MYSEVLNLGRFISVMKFRPLIWRNTHPYVLVDRMEDLTDPEQKRVTNNTCSRYSAHACWHCHDTDIKMHDCWRWLYENRTITLYGWVRGTYLKQNMMIHVPGCGDFELQEISMLSDPCPLPTQERKRTLNEKDKLLYAPMSDIGNVAYDNDVVYINLHHPSVAADTTKQNPSNFENSEGNL